MPEEKSWREKCNPFLIAVMEATWAQDWEQRNLVMQYMLQGKKGMTENEFNRLPEQLKILKP